jgi:tetratricopeptide (TPR) repeat protein
VPKYFLALPLLLLLGAVIPAPAARSQAILPHTLELDQQQLEQEGLAIAQDAIQLIRFQEFEEALIRAKLATQLAPNAFETWALLGGLYLSLDQADKSVIALQKSLSLDRKNAGVYFSLGAAYFRQGNYLESIKMTEAGLAIKPNVPDQLFGLGNAYLKLKEFPKAISQYKNAIAQDQKFWPAINNIALIQYESGDKQAAIKNWLSAIAIDNKVGEPKLALAAALYSLGKVDEGLNYAEAALKLDSRYADVKFLQENLWGERLIADTQSLLATPQIKATLSRLASESSPPPQ